MLDFGKEIEELKENEKENIIAMYGVGGDTGICYYVDDDIASQIKAILDKAAAPRLWCYNSGKKTANSMAKKILSKDGEFEMRKVALTIGGTAYQIHQYD